ncbi:MAG: hypothetical protein SH850_28295 [Planctomycetaceae bacterium]|nr:hypothetical protein [Planctomycetaceae bacterium]
MKSGRVRAVAVCSGLLLATVSANSGSCGWPFKKSCPEAPCASATSCPTCDKKNKLKDPPDAAVVASIPAIMLPQTAIAIPPQRLEAALRAPDQDRSERLLQLLERLDQRQQQAAPAAAAATSDKLQTELDLLEQRLEALRALRKELEKQSQNPHVK